MATLGGLVQGEICPNNDANACASNLCTSGTCTEACEDNNDCDFGTCQASSVTQPNGVTINIDICR